MRIAVIFLFVLSLLMFSCNTESRQKQPLYYFDLNGYFEKEADRLSKLNPKVTKAIKRNSETESQTLSNIAWKTELLVFKESDINKTALKEVYDVDSTFHSDNLQIVYTANSAQAVVQQIRLLLSNSHTVKRIEIEKNPKKKIFEARSQLIYVPDSGYTISNKQKLVTFSEDTYSIQTTFIN